MTTTKMIIAGIFFLFIFLFGYSLNRSGKPYSTLILTLHKLISLAAFAFLAWTIYQVNQEAALSTVELVLSVLSGVFFVGSIISGGLLSTHLELPESVKTVHQITPRLTLITAAVSLYLLLART
jgi:hypothetical protein